MRRCWATVAGHGVAVVLATSAPEKELKLLREALGAEDDLTAVTSADDADRAKPAPDLLQVALAKVDVTTDRAVMVGDTVWDGQACKAARVRFVGLLSGGISSTELRAAGAVAISTIPPTCWPISTTARSRRCGFDIEQIAPFPCDCRCGGTGPLSGQGDSLQR